MARQCEPMGVAEIAHFLGVKTATVHMWQFRKNLPPHTWVVNGGPAWNMSDIIGWAIATDRLDPQKLDETIDAYAPQLSSRGRNN